MAVPDRLAWHDYIRKTAYVCTHCGPAGDHFSIVCLFINPAHWAFVHSAVGFLVSPCGCCTALYRSGRSRFLLPFQGELTMSFEDYLLFATTTAIDSDVPDELLPIFISDNAARMAHMSSDTMEVPIYC
jgi:hypothetical protein